jgi:hypothetical protein
MERISILAPKLNKFHKWKRSVSNIQKMIFRSMFGYSQSGTFSDGQYHLSTVVTLSSAFAKSQAPLLWLRFLVTIQFVPHGEHRMHPSQRTMGESFFHLTIRCSL